MWSVQRKASLVVWAAGVLGCSSPATHVTAPEAGVCAAGTTTDVAFTTEDDVALQGDLYATGRVGGPAAILLHMIPPQWNRTSYPSAFIDKLVAAGLTVLNLDRRGAGGSGGTATEAYTGPNGKLDVKAAVRFLAAHPCAIDTKHVVLIGASNGTTSALDYTVNASGEPDPSAPPPAALVFLTGGTYTENQTSMATAGAALAPIPMLFVFSTAERQWSVAQRPGAPAGWRFQEYDPGAHGTQMFGVQPGAMDEIASFAGAATR